MCVTIKRTQYKENRLVGAYRSQQTHIPMNKFTYWPLRGEWKTNNHNPSYYYLFSFFKLLLKIIIKKNKSWIAATITAVA